jgi:RimJ/RimL family protein N-acetyltransferase/isopentenyldiphosphate isomerase
MILGELVNLRAVDLDDVRVIYRWLNDQVVMDGWGDSAATISQSGVTRKIAGWLEDEEKLGRPVGFVIERLDGEAIGLLVAMPTDQEQRVFQLSLLIGDSGEWGKGFGRDALDAFIDVAFDEWNVRRLWLEVETGNDRAERLYRSAGFQLEAKLRGARYRYGVRQDVRRFGLTSSMRSGAETYAPESKAQDPGELFDVVTANGEPTGIVKPRGQVHRDGDWHRSIHLWIYGVESGVPFLDFQRRGEEKDTWPGKLDATVAGHLGAGEQVNDALREVDEEVGISIVPTETRLVGVRISSNEGDGRAFDRELQQLFLVRRDGPIEAYRPNPDEVAAIVRLRLDDAIALLSGALDQVTAVTIDHHRTVAELVVTRDDFIPSVDQYFIRVCIAVRRSIAGDEPIVV